MVKKADRTAAALNRESDRQRYELEDAAMKAFLDECRASMPADAWQHHYAEASRTAGELFHVVEYLIFVLASEERTITPGLRKSIDAMLESLSIDRRTCNWEELARLNYGKYWQAYYGYA